MGHEEDAASSGESSARPRWWENRKFDGRIRQLTEQLNEDQRQLFTVGYPVDLDRAEKSRAKAYICSIRFTAKQKAQMFLLLCIQQSSQTPPRSFSAVTSASADEQ
jgi:hypothetical protein